MATSVVHQGASQASCGGHQLTPARNFLFSKSSKLFIFHVNFHRSAHALLVHVPCQNQWKISIHRSIIFDSKFLSWIWWERQNYPLKRRCLPLFWRRHRASKLTPVIEIELWVEKFELQHHFAVRSRLRLRICDWNGNPVLQEAVLRRVYLYRGTLLYSTTRGDEIVEYRVSLREGTKRCLQHSTVRFLHTL